MKSRPFYRCTPRQCLWLILALSTCTGTLLNAAEYEHLFGRHATQHRRKVRSRFTADLLILGRSRTESVNILYSNPDGGPVTPLLSTGDLDFEAAISGRYDLILTDQASDYELQFTFTGFPDDRSSSATRTDPDIITRFFGLSTSSAPAEDPSSPSGQFTANYESKFSSLEVNLRRPLGPRVTLFSGIRYVGLQEDLDAISATSDSTITGTRTDADNALYGVHMGAESTIWTNGRMRLDVTGRGGVFLNHIEAGWLAAVAADDPDDAPVVTRFERQTDEASFVGDLQMTLFVPLGPGSLRIGYQLFWVNEAAVLPDQFDDLDFSDNSGDFDLSSPLYQGGFVGFEIPF